VCEHVFVLTTRQQGDLGEASAALWFALKEASVAFPVGHSPDWDLVVEWRGGLHRVQVKTCTRRTPTGNWNVMLCTRGGNQSWSGTTKYFDPGRSDYLFVHVGDGRRWLIPTNVVEGRTAITLGGPKYAEYEVERGEPLPLRTPVDRAA
jgi:hypothetical protein